MQHKAIKLCKFLAPEGQPNSGRFAPKTETFDTDFVIDANNLFKKQNLLLHIFLKVFRIHLSCVAYEAVLKGFYLDATWQIIAILQPEGSLKYTN